LIQLPTSIDPAEAVAAIVGIRPVLTSTFERITASQWDQIGALDKTVNRLARDLARGTLDRSKFEAVNYDKYLDALSKDPDSAQIENIVEQFPIEMHSVTATYLGQVGKTLRFLRSKFPISTYKTIFGATNVTPPDTAIFAFEDLLRLIDDPLSAFEAIDCGTLTSDQAVAIQSVYPSLYHAIVQAIVLRVVKEEIRQGSNYDPHFAQPMAVLLGVPGLDSGLRQLLQTPAQRQQQPQQVPEPNSNTQAQRLAPASEKSDFND
jgi:hypothetical protein